jgi:hypothetical protein
MSEDPRITTMRQQLGRLEVIKARANADYMQALENGDDTTACEAAQEYADADEKRVSLLNTAQRIAYAEQAAAPREPSREERMAKPLDRMDWNDVWEISKSKYGDPDPERFRAAIAHVQNNPTRGR